MILAATLAVHWSPSPDAPAGADNNATSMVQFPQAGLCRQGGFQRHQLKHSRSRGVGATRFTHIHFGVCL